MGTLANKHLPSRHVGGVEESAGWFAGWGLLTITLAIAAFLAWAVAVAINSGISGLGTSLIVTSTVMTLVMISGYVIMVAALVTIPVVLILLPRVHVKHHRK